MSRGRSGLSSSSSVVDWSPAPSYVLCSPCVLHRQQLIDVLLQHEAGEYTICKSVVFESLLTDSAIDCHTVGCCGCLLSSSVCSVTHGATLLPFAAADLCDLWVMRLRIYLFV